MPAPKKPTTFDAHVGAVVNGLARPHGGRQFIADLLGVSMNTIHRRMVGESGFTVKEFQVIAKALNTTPEDIVEQALRNYGDGDEQVGYDRLVAEDDAPTSTNVGDFVEDDFDVTPEGPKEGYALAANKRRKKVDTPHAE